MLNYAFKKIAISLEGSTNSSFSLFSGRGSLRDSKIAESVTQGIQEKDKKRSSSSPRALRAHSRESPRASKNAVLELSMAHRSSNSAKFCSFMLNYVKILLESAKIVQIPTESNNILLNVGRSSHQMMNSRGRR